MKKDCSTKLVRDWNSKHPVGTEVVYHGKQTNTDTIAFVSTGNDALVFLNGIYDPVNVGTLTVTEK